MSLYAIRLQTSSGQGPLGFAPAESPPLNTAPDSEVDPLKLRRKTQVTILFSAPSSLVS